MKYALRALPLNQIKLLPGLFRDRFELNRRYVMSLRDENLLQNHYLEAGLWGPAFETHNVGAPKKLDDCHWGWESPTCQVRGQFLGHWLSAAARIFAATGDERIKARADFVVSELARCQEENGGEWVGSIPEKYLRWIAKGKWVWAPHYVVHKLFMGLLEMASLAGNEQALEIATRWAKWFYRWTGQFSRDQMDDILDFETGGMMEAWADLYHLTKNEEHLELMRRYERRRLFDPLLAGEDVLTNMHANTTIPEVHGAARAFEVTGETKWRHTVEAYWRSAVIDRGFFCTGGQTCGEVWTAPGELSARLGDKNQEHCTVYNMMRLAEWLLRWTGEVPYADYWERNLYNGILAQQNPHTGMVAYFLPLRAGSAKKWGTPTRDFWCCHGTLVQAHAAHGSGVYFESSDGLTVCQYVSTELNWKWNGIPVKITLTSDGQAGDMQKIEAGASNPRRPRSTAFALKIACEKPVEFALNIRLPWWLDGEPLVEVNGEPENVESAPSSFVRLSRTWGDDTVRVTLPKKLAACPLPDMPETVAFMDGPVVLAGLCDEERLLFGDADNPQSILTPDNEREWATWQGGYRTVNQERGLRFIPLHEVTDQRYTVYFPIRKTP